MHHDRDAWPDDKSVRGGRAAHGGRELARADAACISTRQRVADRPFMAAQRGYGMPTLETVLQRAIRMSA